MKLKEILQGINKEKLPEKFQWNISLRVPNNFKGKRDYSINVNNDRNPFWGVMVVNDQKELSVKPGYNLNQKEFLDSHQNFCQSAIEKVSNFSLV